MRARFLAVGLLILSFALALTSAVQKSPTMDEQNHIARGAAYLGTGDPRLSVEHPPLVNLLSALPVHLLLDLHLPLDQWWEAGEWYHFADNFLWRANQHPDRMVFLARLPIIGIGLLLAALVFRWADALFGPWGGLLATAFCALDPNILAHERLSTTDIGGTFFSFLAAYVFWRWLHPPLISPSGRETVSVAEGPSLTGVLLAGLTLGLAFAAKLSALVFGPILALTLLLEGVLNRSATNMRKGSEAATTMRKGSVAATTMRKGSVAATSYRLWHRVVVLAIVAALSLLVIWASYGFQVGPVEGVGAAVPAAPYVKGVQAVRGLAGGGRPAYLLGQISTTGWWTYFPIAFAVKTPLATLFGLTAATWLLTRRPTWDDLFILLPPLLFFLIATTVRLNLGYRHLLPMLPFLALHIGRLVHLPSYRGINLSIYLSVAVALWLAISTLSIYPHFLAAFNPIGGGPSNGWRVLVDSNIDWGQDLKGLASWMERENVERVKLSWFGSARPEAYGIAHDLLPGVPYGFVDWQDPPFDPQQPEPGVYAISVSNLVGVALPDHDLYAWFSEREPSTKIGYSVFIYRVAEP